MKKGSAGRQGAARWKVLRTRVDDVRGRVGPYPHRENTTKQAMVAAVGLAVVCGPLALINSLGSGGSAVAQAVVTPQSAPADPHTVLAEQVRAAAAAQEFLAQWLTADRTQEKQIRSLLLEAPTSLQLSDTPGAAPTRLVVTAATNPADGVWLVTVAASGGASGAGESYQVPVRVTGLQAGVITLPSRVGDAPAPDQEVDGPDYSQILAASPAARTAEGFLKSWLTNAGDVTRWTTPGLVPAPLTGPACTRVVLASAEATQQDIETLDPAPVSDPTSSSPSPTPDTSASPQPAAGRHGVVRATVTCTTKQATRLLTYQLVMDEVAGQLAVASVNPYTTTK